MSARHARGFTLIEVLVALAVVAMGLAALMTAVSSTANASGYLRLKAQAQWIALNRLVEVRLNLQSSGLSSGLGSGLSSGLGSSSSAGLGSGTSSGLGSGTGVGASASASLGSGTGSGGDAGELDFANQHWHYDTQYFDTSIATMRRVVVRVYAGTADTKGPAIAEATGFLGSAVATPGSSNNVDWTYGSVAPTNTATTNGKTTGSTLPPAGSAANGGFGTLGTQGGLGGSSLGSSSSSDGLSGFGNDQSGSSGDPNSSGGTGLN